MPRKHSTVSLFSPTYATTLTGGSLQGISLDQNQGVYNDILLYFNAYIKPYYITRFLGDYNAQLELMNFDNQHGAEVETKVRKWKVDSSTSTEDTNFVKVLSEFVYHHILCIRRAFAILNTNDALTQEIAEMQSTIEEQDAIIQSGSHLNNKRFQAALLCNVKGTISLDLRYWLYIKEHGSPPDGNFDPEKLAKYKYIDETGNILSDQDYLQYTGLGIENTTKFDDQVIPTIFTHPVLAGPTQTTEDITNVDVSDNILTDF
tara:strand:- start:3978 stop:4760 length:783 start_codon:yes stop_codon:yes gene_type:complete